MAVTDLAAMQALNEYDFTHQYVMRLFMELGFFDVRYTGGFDEHGRDVMCYEFDKAGTRIDVGIQVKDDRLSGSATARNIINQVDDAYENPFINDRDQSERNIGKFYVITSKDITNPFKRRIKNGVKYPVYFMDGKTVHDKLNKQISTMLEYSEIEHLMSEKSFTELLQDEEWLTIADEMMVFLFKDSDNSPLQCINNLPNLLGAESNVKVKLVETDDINKKSILHWLSIELVLKAYFIMSKTSKFTLFAGGS